MVLVRMAGQKSIGIPGKLLHESEGHTVTVRLSCSICHCSNDGFFAMVFLVSEHTIIDAEAP